jgi:hypothetical protein
MTRCCRPRGCPMWRPWSHTWRVQGRAAQQQGARSREQAAAILFFGVLLGRWSAAGRTPSREPSGEVGASGARGGLRTPRRFSQGGDTGRRMFVSSGCLPHKPGRVAGGAVDVRPDRPARRSCVPRARGEGPRGCMRVPLVGRWVLRGVPDCDGDGGAVAAAAAAGGNGTSHEIHTGHRTVQEGGQSPSSTLIQS